MRCRPPCYRRRTTMLAARMLAARHQGRKDPQSAAWPADRRPHLPPCCPVPLLSFTKSNEIFVGRMAMLGVAAALLTEVVSGQGPLHLLGVGPGGGIQRHAAVTGHAGQVPALCPPACGCPHGRRSLKLGGRGAGWQMGALLSLCRASANFLPSSRVPGLLPQHAPRPCSCSTWSTRASLTSSSRLWR